MVPTHQYTAPGIYDIMLAVETQTGCKDTTIMRRAVKVVESPMIHIGGDSVICVNQSMRHLGVFERIDTSAIKWQWQFPNGSNSALQNPTLQQYKPGNYTVKAIATNSSGCADTTTKDIIIHALPVITLPPSLTKIVGMPVTLPATYSSGTINYSWTPANTLDCPTCPQPIATPKFTTNYKVAVIDSNNCVNNAEIQVKVICEGATIFAPNTFSPNGDGVNDIFYIRGKGLDRVKSLRIFNRWGEVVFEQRDFPVNSPQNGWDGRYKGNKPAPEVYIYQVEVFCENGEIIRFEGNIALIK
jgi:gliding motility-associated-like protein